MIIDSAHKICALEKQIREFPDEPRYRMALAREYLDVNRFGEAKIAANEALRLEPDCIQAHLLIVDALQRQNKLNSANRAVDRALALAADEFILLVKAAELRQLTGRLQEAETLFGRAFAISPDNTRLKFQLANLLLEQCRYREAAEQFTILAEGRFFRAEAYTGLAHVAERQGDLDQAQEYINMALGCDRQPSSLALQTLADIACQSGVTDSVIDRVEAGLQRSGISRQARARLHFALGRLLDKAGDYRNAFAHFRSGNELMAPDYDWSQMGVRCRTLREKFTPVTVASMAKASNHSERPVFIVGLPRSGTSLVERVLAAHPGVCAAGELEDIRLLAAGVSRTTGSADPGPIELSRLGTANLDKLALRYLERLDKFDSKAIRVIDKMPGNLMYLGLMSALFPSARIIHCVRNPLDTCLSSYFQQFHSSNSLAYTFSLDALAFTWKEQERLMAHWKAVLPNRFIDVKYEDFVDDFDRNARSLIEFCGLEWSESVRTFYEGNSSCYTASYYQVRKPIYRASVDRWRNYADYIQPLIDELGPAA